MKWRKGFVAWSSPQRPPQLIGRLQRRHQRFGGHGEGFVVAGFARDDAASGDALQLVVIVGVDPHLGQGDRQPYRLLVVQDLVDFGLRLAF